MATPTTGTGVELATAYGISEALLAAYPELRQVYELFKQDNIGLALETLFKTNYYRNTSTTVKAREKQRLEQPQVYADTVAKYKIAARKRLVDAGIRIDNATFDTLVEDAYAKNLSDDQLDQAIVNSGKITGYGGNVLGITNELKSFATSMGVGGLLTDSYWTQKGKDLFSGTTTYSDIQQEIKNLSASAFPAYSEGINQGKSLESQTTNVLQSISTFLEMDSDVAANHPVYKKILSYKDPTTGKFAQMPQWLVERTVKSEPDYWKTKDALDKVNTIGNRPLQEWGLIYGG